MSWDLSQKGKQVSLRVYDGDEISADTLLFDSRSPGVEAPVSTARDTQLSGYTADVIAQRGVLDEGIQFLSKPLTREDLARKVRAVLEAPCPV